MIKSLAMAPRRDLHEDQRERHYVWRAVDHEGEVLESFVTKKRDKKRERAMLRFPRTRSLQKFASVHASVTNQFNLERSLSSRPLFKANRADALAEWRGLCSA